MTFKSLPPAFAEEPLLKERILYLVGLLPRIVDIWKQDRSTELHHHLHIVLPRMSPSTATSSFLLVNLMPVYAIKVIKPDKVVAKITLYDTYFK